MIATLAIPPVAGCRGASKLAKLGAINRVRKGISKLSEQANAGSDDFPDDRADGNPPSTTRGHPAAPPPDAKPKAEEPLPVADGPVAAQPADSLLLPHDYRRDRTIPVVIWLHGYGDDASLPIEQSGLLRRIADRHSIAFLGVSGPLLYINEDSGRPIRGKYQWTEDPERDAARIEGALLRASRKLLPKHGHIVLWGFSQGASVAIEVAVRNPKLYAGALAFSPGALTDRRLASELRPIEQPQYYYLSVGAGEHKGNLELSMNYRRELEALGATVDQKRVGRQRTHSFPPNFERQFESWVQRALKYRARSEKALKSSIGAGERRRRRKKRRRSP